MSKGKVYLVGAGPAGKDLITVKGLEILRQAEVVIYDYLVDKELLDEARPDAELISCDRNIDALMVKKAKAGKMVVRLKNGDPFIFGRASEEMAALSKNKIEYEVVPGVTAASAAAVFSGIPLTDRRLASSVVFVTGYEAEGKKLSAVNWRAIAAAGTIVLYMAVENLAQIVDQLIRAGKSADIPAAAIYQAGRINQWLVVSRLKELPAAIKKRRIKAPAIFIIGEVVRLSRSLNWFKRNKRILFTGLSDKRYLFKGTYFHLPMIEIKPLESYADFDRQLKAINTFDWIVFTSRFGVQYFFARLGKIGLDARALYKLKIAAIGNSTANKLKEWGIIADLTPEVETSRGLLVAFRKIPLNGEKIFLPHSDLSDKGLAAGLRRLGAEVTSLVAYRNVMPKVLPELDLKRFDKFIFTSPSGVRNFVKRYGLPPAKSAKEWIGEVTRRQAQKSHLL